MCEVINLQRIKRLMHLSYLSGISRRAAPDLVRRQFTATNIYHLRVADMINLPTWGGFVYLAAVIDVKAAKWWVRSLVSK